MEDQSSLQLYNLIKTYYRCSLYLHSKENFEYVQLKFKVRTGVGGLRADFHQQHTDSGHCKYCGAFETVKHFILTCDVHRDVRLVMFSNLKQTVHENDCFNSHCFIFRNSLVFKKCV